MVLQSFSLYCVCIKFIKSTLSYLYILMIFNWDNFKFLYIRYMVYFLTVLTSRKQRQCWEITLKQLDFKGHFVLSCSWLCHRFVTSTTLIDFLIKRNENIPDRPTRYMLIFVYFELHVYYIMQEPVSFSDMGIIVNRWRCIVNNQHMQYFPLRSNNNTMYFCFSFCVVSKRKPKQP